MSSLGEPRITKRSASVLGALMLLMLGINVPLRAQQTDPDRVEEQVREQHQRNGDKDRDEAQLPPGMSPLSPEDDDPDLPRFMKGLSKEEYFKLRERQIELYRGNPLQNGTNLRTKAVESLNRAEAEQARIRAQGLGKIEANLNSSAWTWIGPAPLPNGQTTTVSTAISGRTTAIAVHPTNANKVYAGTAQGGVFRSLDGGTTWTPIFDAAGSLAIGAIAIDPNTPTTIYVGTGEPNFGGDCFFGVGVYRIDNAESIFPSLVGPLGGASNPMNGRGVSKILVSPTTGTIFVATGSGLGGISGDPPSIALSNRGVWRSTNANAASASAVTFTQLTVVTAAAAANNRAITDIIFDPNDATGNTMFAAAFGLNVAGDGGIYFSTNAMAVTPTFTNVLVLGTATNGVSVKFAAVKVGATRTLYATTSENPGGTCTLAQRAGRVKMTTNNGAPFTFTNLAASNGFCGGQCVYDAPIAVDPTNANIFLIGGAGNSGGSCPSFVMRRTINGGGTFAQNDTGLHADSHAITFAPSSSSTVYAGNDGGIFKSTDGGSTWSSLNNGQYSATQFQSIALHPIDQDFMIGGTQDNGTECLGTCGGFAAGQWNRVDYGDGGFALIDQNATNTTNNIVAMYHTYYNQAGSLMAFGRVTNTTTAFENWAALGCGGTANGIACSDTAVLFYAPMALGPGNPNTLYFGTDRIYRSANLGTTMTAVSQQFVANTAVSAIGVNPTDDNKRLVGLENGTLWGTYDGNSTLTNLTGAIPAKFISRIVYGPTTASSPSTTTAYISLTGFGLAAGQHIWKTTNFTATLPAPGTTSATWTASGTGIPDVPVNALSINPWNNNVLYAGTDIGVYRSADAGATWQPFSSGLPRVAVFDSAYHKTAAKLRIATHGRGIWEIEDCPMVVAFANTTTSTSSCPNVVSWSAATPRCAYSVTYNVYRGTTAGFTPDATTRIASGLATLSYNDSAPGGTYFYRVGAVDSKTGVETFNNVSAAVTSSCANLPTPLPLLTATAKNATVQLQWTLPTVGTGLTIRFNTAASPSACSYPANTGLGTGLPAVLANKSVTHSSLTNGTTVCYAAFVTNAAGTSTAYNVAATPQAVATTPGATTWIFNTAAAALTSPGISTNLFAVSNDRYLHKIDPTTSGGMWPANWTPFAMNGPSQSRPTVINTSANPIGLATEVAFIGSQDGSVYAINSATGALLWSRNLGTMVQAAPMFFPRAAMTPALPNDLIVVGTRNGAGGNSMYGLNANDGTVLWQFTNSVAQGGDAKAIGMINGPAAFDTANGRIYFATRQLESAGSSTNTIWCVTFAFTAPSTWAVTKTWANAIGDIDGSPTRYTNGAAINTLYVGTNHGEVYAYDAVTGANLWTAQTNQKFDTSDGPVKGFVTVDRNNTPRRLYFATTNAVWAIDDNLTKSSGATADASFAWKQSAIGFPSVPVFTGTQLLFGSSNGNLYQIKTPGTTPALSSIALGSATTTIGSPTFSQTNNLVYVGSGPGTIFGVTPN